MEFKKLRRRLIGGVAATTAIVTPLLGSGMLSASASTPASSPQWITGTVQTDRGSGSDTTYFLMVKLGDLYNQAGLQGCALGPDDYTCQDDTAPYTAANNPDNPATTDYTDNYDRTEEVQGVDEVGSGAGQAQLCGANIGSSLAALPPWAKVDYARSSSGINSGASCVANLVAEFFAADAVDLLSFSVNPSNYGTATSAPYSSVNGGNIGNVSEGWLPGDPTNCDTVGATGNNGVNACSGWPFASLGDLDNASFSLASGGDGQGTGANSLAYRIWCSTATSGSGAKITDWGQLTNVGVNSSGLPTVPIGNGTPIGIPINLIGVNPASGTNKVWTAFVQGTGPSCSSNVNAYAAPGQSQHIALENNAAQLDDFATTDYPGKLPEQAAELDTALYYVANGVYASNHFEAGVYLTTGGVKNATILATFPGLLEGLNGGQFPVAGGNVYNQTYPTARKLSNIYRNDQVRASTAAFLDWICDDNNAFTKSVDLTNGKSYEAEVNNLINTQFGFVRYADNSPGAGAGQCPLITSVANATS